MNEIQRLQQLADILTEIKVNNPNVKFSNLRLGEKYDLEGENISETGVEFDGYNPVENNKSAFFKMDPNGFEDDWDEEDGGNIIEFWEDELTKITPSK